MVAAIDRYEPTAPRRDRAGADPDAAGSPLRFDGAGVELAPIDHISASRLIALAGCPLQYLFAAGLGLEEVPELPGLGELDERRLGTLFHLALSGLYERIVPRGAPPVADAARRAAALLPELLAAALREVDPQRDLPAWLAPARIAQWTRRLSEFVADDLRAIAERGLRGGDRELDVVLPFPHGERSIAIRGRIDRILRDAGGAEWIGDYKSAAADSLRKRASLKAVLRGAELQLPIYALARAAPEGVRIAGLELLSLAPRRPGSGGRFVPLDVAELRERDGDLRALLAALLAQRERASFPLNPDDDLDHGRCGSCAFRRACRHSHGPTVERVAAAAANEPWFRAITAADGDADADAAEPGTAAP
jgi:RecB family exonuclease